MYDACAFTVTRSRAWLRGNFRGLWMERIGRGASSDDGLLASSRDCPRRRWRRARSRGRAARRAEGRARQSACPAAACGHARRRRRHDGAVLHFGRASTTRNPMFMFFPVMMLVSVLGTLAYGARGANRTAEMNEDRRDYLGYLDALDQTRCQDGRSTSIARCTGSIPTLSRCGRWPVADACGSAASTIPTSAMSGSAVATSRSAPRWWRPQLGPVEAAGPCHLVGAAAADPTRSVVADLPVAVPLRTTSAVTVDGDPAAARALCARWCASWRSCTAPKMSGSRPWSVRTSDADWDWLKWLPHHQHPRLVDALGPARMTYRSLGEAITACRPPDDGGLPHVVIVVD